MKNYYTIGEIFRKGLLKNHRGLPYTNKGTISKIVNGLNYKEKKTPWGPSKVIHISEIKRHNKKYRV